MRTVYFGGGIDRSLSERATAYIWPSKFKKGSSGRNNKNKLSTDSRVDVADLINVGHASLELPDGTYISWWPGGPHKSLSEDIHYEKCEPRIYSLCLPYGYDNIVKEWWQKLQRTETYDTTGMNCSKVVYLALKKNGVTFNNDEILVWKPTDIMKNIDYKYILWCEIPKEDEVYSHKDDVLCRFGIILRYVPICYALLFICVIGFVVWFGDNIPAHFKIGYGLCGAACIVMFIGLIFAVVRMIMARYEINKRIAPIGWKIMRKIPIYLARIGALLYFMGGCGIAYGYDHDSSINGSLGRSIAAIYFAENTFVSMQIIHMSIPKIFIHNKKYRQKIDHRLFLLISIFDFFAYAVIGSIGTSKQLRVAAQYMTTMYFFAIFLVGGRIIANEYIFTKKKLLLGFGCFVMVLVLLLIAYWVWMTAFREFGFRNNAQFFATGQFVFACGLVIALDLIL
eukprot:422821_1